jgi:hypothetical protein
MATCPGSLILHRNGTVAGCTLDDLDADDRRAWSRCGHELRPNWTVLDRTGWDDEGAYSQVRTYAAVRVRS